MFRKGGKSTSMNTGGRRRVATEFEDGGEMIEEYDLKTDELLLRKRPVSYTHLTLPTILLV